ncbi:MAG: hypothetical protein GX075_14335 [Firmicutes bacterium]|nr:hypothetical protein [Bacillota bacterium]
MNRIFKYLSLSVFLIVLISSLSFGAGDTMSLEETYKVLENDKGKSGYLIGKFPMVHLRDSSIGYPQIVNESSDINHEARFSIRMELVNTANKRKKYTIFFKPVNGSDTGVYYLGKEKMLQENTDDPYWIIKVPAGSYELANFLCSLTLVIPGYQDFREPIYDVPMTELIKRPLNIRVNEKQIVYIGDYDTVLITYICLNKVESLYPFGRLGIKFQDNFEDAKAAFLNGADPSLKEKLNEYQFVSAL